MLKTYYTAELQFTQNSVNKFRKFIFNSAKYILEDKQVLQLLQQLLSNFLIQFDSNLFLNF